MKIGIHQTKGTFSERWIEYCEAKGIGYKLVDCYQSDIIKQLEDCDALMWHFSHNSPKAILFAKQLIYSLETAGKIVFPDFHTVWHFDDKIGQKYLLESVNAPCIPTSVFYNKKEALNWVAKSKFPKVFKLRGGAGSENVRLVHSANEANKLIRKAFGTGFSKYNATANLKDRWRKYRLGKTDFYDVIKGIIRFMYLPQFANVNGKENGYIYFQDFIPDNSYDIRIIVIEDKAFGIKRMVRKDDFRASGSGNVLYEKENFEDDTVRLSFNIAEKIKSQCTAFDFIYQDGKPLVVEVSYGFSIGAYDLCIGYWDKNLKWYPGKFIPQEWMVEILIKKIESNKNRNFS